ncbi:Opsin Rh3-like [Limulus polyphemus]|uniref:Opsin Rh3-like n=1 Tax=Limulus polyphemus TaxID=6850 RepID=G1FK53_LIMPO|nr:Opsin Rh3-like [Limulus polyphemus]AEL29244.1 UVopsin [Limulus polyphemus]
MVPENLTFRDNQLDFFFQAEPLQQEIHMNGWNAPKDMFINPYWKQFEAPNPFMHYLLGILYTGLMIVACIGNGIVIYVFSMSKTLRTPANLFVVALAVTDFLMMLKTPVFIYNSFHAGPVYGNIGCIIYGTVGAYSGLMSAFCNAVISYDRYRVIACPFSSSKLTNKKAVAMLLGIVLYVSPFALLPAFEIWNRYVPEGYLTSCTADYFQHDLNGRSFIFCIWFFAWFIPVIIIFCCYFRIYAAVRDHENQLREQAKKMNVENLRTNQNQKDTRGEIRIAKVAFGIIMLFLFSWVPYILVAFIGAFSTKERQLITPLMSMVPALTLKASACFDPFIYAINHPKYRLELQKKIPWLCIHESYSDNASTCSNKTQLSGDTTPTVNSDG